jgi:hypothetical protein
MTNIKLIKRILLFLILGINYSCFYCDYTGTSEKGLRSKKYYKNYLNKRVNPENVKIKTDLVYKSIKYYYDEENKVFSKIKDSVLLKKDTYLRFFKNGTFYSFAEKRNSKPNSDSFNPEKGNIGFLIEQRKKYFLMDYSTINCGSFSKVEFETKGDTLITKYGGNKGFRIWYYYIKHIVPEKSLRFETKI